jgi:hypothetical protein
MEKSSVDRWVVVTRDIIRLVTNPEILILGEKSIGSLKVVIIVDVEVSLNVDEVILTVGFTLSTSIAIF